MKTKIVNGTFHFKRKRFIYWDGAIKSIKQVEGRLRIVKKGRTTYVVCPIFEIILEGIMIPIIEDYDSLEEVKQ